MIKILMMMMMMMPIIRKKNDCGLRVGTNRLGRSRGERAAVEQKKINQSTQWQPHTKECIGTTC